jgi:hypothetical protein
MTKHLTFRLSDEAVATLTKYQQEHKFKTLTEALESYVLRKPEPEITIDSETKDNPCSRRIIISNDHYCVNRPPKAVKLLSLDICAVCKIRQFGFPKVMPEIESKAKPFTPKRIYCPQTTDFVDRQAICGRCHESNYPTWLKCENRLKQEAREQ